MRSSRENETAPKESGVSSAPGAAATVSVMALSRGRWCLGSTSREGKKGFTVRTGAATQLTVTSKG